MSYWTPEEYLRRARGAKAAGDYDVYFMCLTYAADSGNKEAVQQLYDSYLIKENARQNSAKVLKFYETRAQDESNIYSMLHLAILYYGGYGVMDRKKALPLILKLVEKKQPIAMCYLSNYYIIGVDVVGDMRSAIFWATQAFLHGLEREAYYQLAESYYYDSPIKDRCASFRFYKEASKLGHHDATGTLGHMYVFGLSCVKDVQKGIELLQSGVESGSVESMRLLAYKYQTGDGVQKDISRAISLFERAAESYDRISIKALGKIYDSSAYERYNPKKAKKLYKKEIMLGSKKARKRLYKIYYREFRYEKAKRLCKGHDYMLCDLAMAYFLLFKYAKALKTFHKCTDDEKNRQKYFIVRTVEELFKRCGDKIFELADIIIKFDEQGLFGDSEGKLAGSINVLKLWRQRSLTNPAKSETAERIEGDANTVGVSINADV